MLIPGIEYDAKKLLKAFKKVLILDFESVFSYYQLYSLAGIRLQRHPSGRRRDGTSVSASRRSAGEDIQLPHRERYPACFDQAAWVLRAEFDSGTVYAPTRPPPSYARLSVLPRCSPTVTFLV